jgi:O-antigen biosynthesis protein
MPEFDREGGSRRVFHLIEFLREAGWAVSFIAHNAVGGERYAHVLQQMGVATYAGRNPWAGGQESLVAPETLIATGHFDLVLIAFWDHAEPYLPVVRSLSPHARVVVDSVDLHFLRKSRGAFCSRGPDEAGGRLDPQYANEMVRELNVYAAADAVLTVSQKEADLVNDFTGDLGLAHAFPYTEDLEASPVPLAERRGMLFVGNYRHPPNVQAVEYLCGEVLPRLGPALLEEHPAYVVGNGLTDALAEYGKRMKGVKMIGWVPQVLPYLQSARISVIPLLVGAGTKRKLMQSLMVGTPCVSTSIGVEGLDLEDGVHVLVADDPERFAAAARRLLTDDELWQRLSHDGRSHILAAHGRGAVRACFDGVFARIMSKPVKAPAAAAHA